MHPENAIQKEGRKEQTKIRKKNKTTKKEKNKQKKNKEKLSKE